MGLSASQARQLLLTAKRNDLEFRAQQISQQRLILSSQLEEIATEYENVTANRQMRVSVYEQPPEGIDPKNFTSSKEEKNLTYKLLISGCFKNYNGEKVTTPYAQSDANTSDYFMNTAYVLRDTSGRVVVSDPSEIPGISESGNFYGDIIDAINDKSSFSNSKDQPQKCGDYYIQVTQSGTVKIGHTDSKNEDGTQKYEEYVVDPMLKIGSTDEYGETEEINYLQDCLRNGAYLLQKCTPVLDANGKSTGEYKLSGISWDSALGISDRYYTEDDDAAKAKYDRLQNEIQRQDKKLELELDNIETQRSAITTEEESVQKVMDDNIEGTFKTFA